MEEKMKTIEDNIRKIKNSRKILLKKINGRTYTYWGYYTDFLEFLAKKLNFTKKQKKKYKREFEWFFNGNDLKEDYGILNLPYNTWKILEKHIKNILEHQDEFLLKIKKTELQELTHCLRNLDDSNPCRITCETCGHENEIEANFCSQCGEIIK